MEAKKTNLVKLNITLKDADLQKRYDALFTTRSAEDNIRKLLDAYERQQELESACQELAKGQQELANDRQELEKAQHELKTACQELAKGQQELETACQELAKQQQELANDRQTLAENQQKPCEILQKLGVQEVDDYTIVLQPSSWIADLLYLTADKLSKKYNKEVTPQMILLDMFLRYTIEQWNMWFYPFVLTEREIEEISGHKMKELHEYLNKK